MKKIILITGLMVFQTIAYSAPLTIKSCTTISGLANSIMDARQRNMPMSNVMKAAGTNKEIQSMIIEAYQKPRFGTKTYQDNAITDFANHWFLICMQEVSK